jgi:multiple antibiotic resistance protein
VASISLRRYRLGRCGRNWPNSTRRDGNSSSLVAGRRRLILFVFGLQMVFGWIEQTGASLEKGRDLAVFPLAVPAIAGPGAITAVILLTDNDVYSVHERTKTAVVLLIVLALTYLLLLLSDVIVRIIGRQGAAILTRVMGIILTALSVEFVLAGLSIGSWATPHR